VKRENSPHKLVERVINIKLAGFDAEQNIALFRQTPTSRVENYAPSLFS
jgi:hypothetical protein